MRLIRAAWRASLLAPHLVFGSAVAIWNRGALDQRFQRGWCRIACSILGLRVRQIGAPTPGPALFVANHVSWLDVVALGSVTPLGFVAKDDLARWPLIGSLSAAADTIFLRRGAARAAARVVTRVIERLAGGRSVAVFPEGTSTAGETVLAFKSSMFEAAARLGCDVQPVSVSYPRDPKRAAVAPFVGDDEFLPHLLRVLSEPGIAVTLAYAPALSAHGRTRAELAHAARAEVLAGLDLSRPFRRCLVAASVPA